MGQEMTVIVAPSVLFARDGFAPIRPDRHLGIGTILLNLAFGFSHVDR